MGSFARPLKWISLGASILGALLYLLFPSLSLLILLAAGISLLSALLAEWKRLKYLVGLLPVFILAAALHFSGHSEGLALLISILLAWQLRLIFLRSASAAAAKNTGFAEDLRNSLPEKARIFIDIDIEGESPVSNIQSGHLIRIEPEEVIPADGLVMYGSSFVDEGPLTGEREPKAVSMGSLVLAGSKNKNGSFIFKASAPSHQSAVFELAEAMAGKPVAWAGVDQRLLIVEAGAYLLAIAAYLGSGSFSFAASILLLAPGVALLAASNVRIFSFFARSVAEGFAWSGPEAPASLAKSGMLLGCASGVLTEARFRVSAINGSATLSEEAALRFLGPLARKLETTAAFAILKELLKRNIRLEPIDQYQDLPGGGSGIVDGISVRWIDLENARLEGITAGLFNEFAEEQVMEGRPVFLLLQGREATAAFSIEDPIHPSAAEGLKELKKLNVPFVLLTPESQLTLRSLQQELQVLHSHADCDEEEAAMLLERFAKEKLQPAIIAHPGWNLPNPFGPVITDSPQNSYENPYVFSLRKDIRSIARLLKLARFLKNGKHQLFWPGLIIHLLCLPVIFFRDPLLAALIGGLAGFALLFVAKRPLFQRL